jgi:hypothetical protein
MSVAIASPERFSPTREYACRLDSKTFAVSLSNNFSNQSFGIRAFVIWKDGCLRKAYVF